MQMIQALKRDCPHLWTLLNQRAKADLPSGIRQYLCGPGAEEGARQLQLADARVGRLIERTSEIIVGDAYRRQLSSVETENALAEFLCEVTLVDGVAGISSLPPELRPRARKCKSCDVRITVEGTNLYGEVKRFADSWKGGTRAMDRGAKRPHVDRPREMDLISKLKRTYEQLPEGTLNILFLFHPCPTVPTDPRPYIERALFGSSGGLYSFTEWQHISACALSRVEYCGALSIVTIWDNPKAHVRLSDMVKKRVALAQ